MSDEPKRIPLDVLRDLEKLRQDIALAEAQTANARLRYQLLVATIERDHGFRFTAETHIRPDGVVVVRGEP